MSLYHPGGETNDVLLGRIELSNDIVFNNSIQNIETSFKDNFDSEKLVFT